MVPSTSPCLLLCEFEMCDTVTFFLLVIHILKDYSLLTVNQTSDVMLSVQSQGSLVVCLERSV